MAGAAAAFVLVLAVFPGATESTTVGSILLGFAGGSAMLRILSATMTRGPARRGLRRRRDGGGRAAARPGQSSGAGRA